MARANAALPLAKAECTNWMGVKGCLGADVNDQGATCYCLPITHCLLSLGLPCRLFERAVLPLALTRPKGAGAISAYSRLVAGGMEETVSAIKDDELRAVVARHRLLGHDPKFVGGFSNVTRQCACGAIICRERRRCDNCKAERRRGATRARVRRFRQKELTM